MPAHRRPHPDMSDAASAESVVREFWRLMGTNDFGSVSAVLAPELVVEWPQSGERLHGPENFARMNAEYPARGRWRFVVNRLVASGAEVVTQVSVTDGTQSAEPVSFFTVHAGKVVRLVEYWPEPFAPAANRSHLVERTERAAPAAAPAMCPRISLVTLAVENLERAVAFYRDGLGLPTQGIVGTEFELGAVAFFELETGLKLAVWPRSSLLADSGLPPGAAGQGSFCLAHNVGSRPEVEAVLAQAERAGATILKPAQPAFWGGWSGYFQDPDGHLWEVAYNPSLPA